MARWAIIVGSLLAAFQAWLWEIQGYWLGLAIAIATTLALGCAAWRPRSGYARTLMKARVIQRGADESERAYWFRVTLAWVLVAVVCSIGALGIPVASPSASEFATLLMALLIALCFASVLMALQSLLYCIFHKTDNASPDTSLQ